MILNHLTSTIIWPHWPWKCTMSIDIQDKATLLGFYAPLLTAKQSAMAYDHYYDDLSIAEIAQNHNISRAAVFDTLRKVDQSLIRYESKLHLASKFAQREAIYAQLMAYNDSRIQACVHALEDIDE